jgi:6-phosphogluconolactonase
VAVGAETTFVLGGATMIGRLVLCSLLWVPALFAPAFFPVLAGPEPARVQQDKNPDKLWVFVGTYTRNTKSKGIYRSELDVATGKLAEPVLAAESDNPSFLAVHPSREFLYAVNEISDFGNKEGAVSAFSLNGKDGTLELLNQQGSHGAAPCHLCLDPAGKVVLVANYGGGSVCVLPIDDGKKQEDMRGYLQKKRSWVTHAGHGTNKERQEGPHPHCVLTDPTGKFALSADLGIDGLVHYTLDADKGVLNISEPSITQVTPGAGPRHLAFHQSGKFLYAVNELDSTVTALAYDGGKNTVKAFQTLTTLPKGYKGNNTAAEIAVHPSGKFLYASNRGYDSIVLYDLDAKTGRLKFSRFMTKKLRTPRHFAIDPTGTWLLAANQDGDTVVVFRIDPNTGLLTETDVEVRVSRPVCITMVPRQP